MSQINESHESFLLPSIAPAWRATVKGLLLIGGIVFVVLYFNRLWSASVDLAHHYTLVSYLSEFWRTPVNAPSLGEMSFYPHYSHALAAIAGTFFSSPLMGLQLVSLLSVYALWVAIVIALATLPARPTAICLLVFVALLMLNRFGLHVEFFGSEIIGNFFYAELVAQAFCAVIYTLMLLMERRGISTLLRYTFCVIALHIAVRTHLLPAIELLGALGLLVIMDVIEATKPRRLRTLLYGGITLFIGCAVIVLDPAFGAMRKISENNGGLPLQWISSIFVLAVVATAVIVLALALAWYWIGLKHERFDRRYLAYKYFACLGVSVGALCLLQILLLRWGLGSEYACRKYAFALQTLALIELSLLASVFLTRHNAPDDNQEQVRPFASSINLGPVFMAAAGLLLGFIPPATTSAQDTARLVTLERVITAINLTGLEPITGKYDFVAGISGIPWPIDYLFSIGILKAPRDRDTLNFIARQDHQDPQRVGRILTSIGAKPLDDTACRLRTFADNLVLLDGACVMAKYRSALCEGAYDFSSRGYLPTGMANGLSGPEPTGRWSDGPAGSITCTFKSGVSRPTQVQIYAHGRVSAGPQRMLVSVNGGASQAFTYTLQNPASPISLDISKIQGEKLTLALKFPDENPASSRDSRRISVFFRRIEFK